MELRLCAGGGRCGLWCDGWLVGRRSVTSPPRSGGLGCRVKVLGRGSGRCLCGHRTGVARMATSRITALPTRSRRRRALRGPWSDRACQRVEVVWCPARGHQTTRTVLHAQRESPATAPTDDEPTPRAADPAHSPRCRQTTHAPRLRPSETPDQMRHPSARNRPGRPRDQRPTTSVSAVRHPLTSDVQVPPQRPPSELLVLSICNRVATACDDSA
jgi:hypothetical protein